MKESRISHARKINRMETSMLEAMHKSPEYGIHLHYAPTLEIIVAFCQAMAHSDTDTNIDIVAHLRLGFTFSLPKPPTSNMVTWTATGDDQFKLNYDGASKGNSGIVATGGLVRDG
ncbi:hypothetical protein Salat_2155000 [Sesamum alatum]|uniref:Uncharacterized protein n=1 Tax=Sesamum alatum TaxID=300844 RepID=A0AAE2CH90_9LAMI|nr:hypothetical protein Salat_2155000 [Sesamum alatum]